MPMCRRRIPIVLSILSLSLLCATLQAEVQPKHNKQPRKEIRQLEQECRAAVIAGDTSVLDRLTADDYIGISPDGTFQTKQQFLSSIASGSLRLEKIEYSDTKIRVYGDSAVVTTTAEVEGRNELHGPFKGKYRYTRVYTRHNDSKNWRIVSFESSRVKGDR